MQSENSIELGKFPIEIFGTLYNDNSPQALWSRNNQYCPYLKRECTKTRKSEPSIKVGICSVGYNISYSGNKTIIPNIICPHRFLGEENLFYDIAKFFNPSWENISVVSEASMAMGGNVDYVAYTNNSMNEVEDFLCIELQANGTTGSPYGYVKELLEHQAYTGKKYTYGLNWANEFSKTMLQQAFKKGKIVTVWHKRIVFVIQDVAMQYLQQSMDTGALRKNMDDNIHFITTTMVWNGALNKYDLKLDEWYSTNVDGISKMIGGTAEHNYPTQDDFETVIKRRETNSLEL